MDQNKELILRNFFAKEMVGIAKEVAPLIDRNNRILETYYFLDNVTKRNTGYINQATEEQLNDMSFNVKPRNALPSEYQITDLLTREDAIRLINYDIDRGKENPFDLTVQFLGLLNSLVGADFLELQNWLDRKVAMEPTDDIYARVKKKLDQQIYVAITPPPPAA